MLRGYSKVTCCQQVSSKDLIANEPRYLCLPSLTPFSRQYLHIQTNCQSPKTNNLLSTRVCMVKNILYQICIKSISHSSEITGSPSSPPLFFTELSDDKVNTRVISLVTALNLFILEGFTLGSRLKFLLGVNRQNQSFSYTPVLTSPNK